MLLMQAGQHGEEIGLVEGGAEALGGDAAFGGALLAQQVEGEVAQHGQVRGTVADADPALVLAEGDIENPMDAVLDPVLSTCGRGSSACDTCRMKECAAPPSYVGYRFPPEIIAHAVWLYYRFALSYRDVEELLAERGVIVTYETIRRWSWKFGQTYANALHTSPHEAGSPAKLVQQVLT